MSASKDLCVGTVDAIVSRLGLDEVPGATTSERLVLTSPMVPDAPVGMPPVGTHGLIWYLMFVHGFVGMALFLGWLGLEVLRSGRVRTADGWWSHLALVIGLVQVPFYGLLPQVVLLGIAAGLSHREDPA